MQRGSSFATGLPVGGYMALCVGCRVTERSFAQVLSVTVPEAGSLLRDWKARTAAVVTSP